MLAPERYKQYKLNHRKDPVLETPDPSFSSPTNPIFKAIATVATRGDYIIPNLPPILDQGQLGSCAAHAGVGALEILQGNLDPPLFQPLSRRFLYWLATSLDGNAGQDAGTYLRSIVQQAHKIGVCAETYWSYSDNAEDLVKPPSEVFIRASENRIYAYYKIDSTGNQRLADICAAIWTNHPVIFGTLVGNAYMTTDGKSPLTPEKNNEGGHATGLMGIQSIAGRLSFRDKGSYSSQWADGGYCWFDQDYITWENTSDLWVMTHVEPLIA